MKITNAIREVILVNAMKASEIPSRRKTTEADLKKFALTIYHHVVNPPKELLEMWGSSEGKDKFGSWINTSMHITFEAEGFYSYNYFNRLGDESYEQYLPSTLSFDDQKLMPSNLGRVKFKGTVLEPLAKALATYHLETNKKEKELRAKLQGVLRSVNTKAQLMKIWPESEKFLPAEVKVEPQRALVDVKSILELNKALGITK